jgi:hypothetical protein
MGGVLLLPDVYDVSNVWPWENSTGMVTPAFLLDFGARASHAHASENSWPRADDERTKGP